MAFGLTFSFSSAVRDSRYINCLRICYFLICLQIFYCLIFFNALFQMNRNLFIRIDWSIKSFKIKVSLSGTFWNDLRLLRIQIFSKTKINQRNNDRIKTNKLKKFYSKLLYSAYYMSIANFKSSYLPNHKSDIDGRPHVV